MEANPLDGVWNGCCGFVRKRSIRFGCFDFDIDAVINVDMVIVFIKQFALYWDTTILIDIVNIDVFFK